MKIVRKSVLKVAIPVAISIAVFKVVKGLFKRKKKAIPEKIRAFTQNAMRDVESVVTELRNAIENKNATQLEKGIDSAVENAKRSIDKIGNQIKLHVRNFENQDPSSPLNIQAS